MTQIRKYGKRRHGLYAISTMIRGGDDENQGMNDMKAVWIKHD